MASVQKSRILFFIAAAVATPKELAAAASLESKTTRVLLRNASAISEGDAIEKADGFAGCVPDSYRARFPDGKFYDEALEAPVVATTETPAAPANPPDFVPPAVAAQAGESPDPIAAQRAAEDEGAAKATAAQLKAALAQLGIEHKSNANKAELLALFLNR